MKEINLEELTEEIRKKKARLDLFKMPYSKEQRKRPRDKEEQKILDSFKRT